MHDRLAAAGNATGEAKEKRAEEAAPLKPVFIHGWVYDLESGTVADLNVSTGPKGFEDFVPSATPTEEGEASTTQSEKETASSTELVNETATTTEEASQETPTEVDAASVVQEPVSATPSAAVNVLGHHVIPVKRSDALARLRRSLPQQRTYGKRFSRRN